MRALLVGLVLAVTPVEAAAAAGREVHDPIAGFTFVSGAASFNTPGQPFRIRTGDTVVWTNLDPMSHDVTFEAIEFSAYLKDPGSTARHTFETPGYYVYHCHEHAEFPGMRGLIFVSDDAP